MVISTLKTCYFETSEDIMTKFKSQALHIIRIKYWKASGSGNPPSLIHALRKIAILCIFFAHDYTRPYSDFDHSSRPHFNLNCKESLFSTFKSRLHSLYHCYICLLSRYFTFLKFTYCEKATKFEKKISRLILTLFSNIKTTCEIFSNLCVLLTASEL